MTRVKTSADRHIPKTPYRLLPYPRPTRATQIARAQFKALRERAARQGWTYDDYRRYIQIRTTLTETRQEEARSSWSRQIEALAHSYSNPEQFWRKLRCLSGRTAGPDSYLIDADGQKLFSPEDKEHTHRRIWEQTYQNNIDNDENNNNRQVLNYLTNNLHRTRPLDAADRIRLAGDSPLSCLISSQEIREVIRSSGRTCPGNSGINRSILMHLPDSAIHRLRDIFNAVLSAGYFPDKFKEAEMRMVPKQGKVLTNPSTYRPISLLEVPGKILERILTRRLRDHLEWEDLYSDFQYGFRRGRGTAHAIALATESLAIHQASRHRCTLVLRDVSKAFDKVWHRGLQFKILHLGLPEPVESVLCNFLENRVARIRVGAHTGPTFPLATGVPQRSVLSPTLYTIYTRDCPPSGAGINVSYADDVTQVVFHPGRSSRMTNARTKREIARVSTYESEWHINTNKTKFAVLPMATERPAPLLVDGEPLQFHHNGTMLGLKLSTRGYLSHITQRTAKAKAALGVLQRFRDLNTRLKLNLVKALVIPILVYPPIPIHAMSRRSISRLQKVQNAALRFAVNHRWRDVISMEEIHIEHDFPALNVRLHNMATQVWQRMSDEEWPQYLHLMQRHEEAPHGSHGWFPRSLLALQNGAPAPRYK